jgi:glycosyltransferase involved in cell wall biosynthesis
MNIALGLVSREAGGAEYQALLLARGLIARGHEVTLYCTDPAESIPMLQQWVPIPTRILHPGPRLGPARRLWKLAQLRAWLHRDRIEAAVGILGSPHAYLTAAVLGTKVKLYGRRSFVWSEIRGFGGYDDYLPRLQRWVARWGWRTTAMVCNTTRAMESAYEVEGWPPESLRLIPNGWPEFAPNGYQSSTPYYVARLRPEKAVDIACQRFAHGGVPLALSADVPDWSQVGILAHCSRADAMSNAVGLAMAHGIPVVAFDLPGNVELLEPGRCVPRWKYEYMIGYVQALLRSRELRIRHGTRCRDRVRTLFSAKAMGDQWEELLTKS